MLEAADRVGGKILTTPFAGRPGRLRRRRLPRPGARGPSSSCERARARPTMLTAPAERSALLVDRAASCAASPRGWCSACPPTSTRWPRRASSAPRASARAAADLDATEAPPTSRPVTPRATRPSVGHLVRGRLGDEVYEELVGPAAVGRQRRRRRPAQRRRRRRPARRRGPPPAQPDPRAPRAAAGGARRRCRPERPGLLRPPGRHPDPHRPPPRPAHRRRDAGAPLVPGRVARA